MALVLPCCSSETVAQPPAAPVNWQSLHPVAVVDGGADIVTARERAIPGAYGEALASPGFGTLASLLDEDVHFSSPGMDDGHGREQVVRAHDALLGSFANRKAVLSRVWRAPAAQTIEWMLTGTQSKEWMGVAATQRQVIVRGLTLLWTRDDGSVTDVHLYVDVARVKAQLGVGPKELVSLAPPAIPDGPTQQFEQTQTNSPDERKNVEVVRSALDSLENNNEVGYVNALTDDVEVVSLERASPAKGKAEARAYYRAMHKAIGQLDTTVDNAWGIQRFAIVEYSIDGEQLGPIGWLPLQRDRVVRFELVDICEIDNGKLARITRYDNPAQLSSGPVAPANASR